MRYHTDIDPVLVAALAAKSGQGGGGSGGTTNYNDLTNKPTINGTTLEGNLTAEDLGLQPENLVVTLTQNGESITADKSYADINQAYTDGKDIYAVIEGNIVPLYGKAGTTYIFQSVLGVQVTDFELNSENEWSVETINIIANSTRPGGIIADEKTDDDTVEVHVDSKTGKAYVNASQDTTTTPPIINTVSGNPITLTDSSDNLLQGFEMDGKTEQVTTTGAQLFDKSTATPDTYINNANGDELTGSDTYASDYIAITGLQNIRVTDTGSSMWMAFYNSEKSFISGINGYSESLSIPEDAAFAKFTIANSFIDTFMVNAGTSLLPWELYTGRLPSPSPDYPQPIINGGTYDEKSEKWEYEVGVGGAQLFDASKIPTKTQGGATVTNNGDGSFTVSGSGNLSSTFSVQYDYSHEETIALLQAGKEIRLNQTSPITPTVVMQLRKNNANYKTVNTTGYTITEEDIQDQTFCVRLNIYGGSGSEIIPGTYKPMVYQDGDGTWEPYKHQSVTLTADRPLTKWDRLEKRNGQWGWVYKSNVVVFDGSEDESFDKNNAGNPDDYLYYITVTDKKASPVLCNKLINKSSIPSGTNPGINGSYKNVNLFVNLGTAIGDNNVTSFKAYLQANPITVLYALSTPIEIPLTPEESAALDALVSYYPTTVISNQQGLDMTVDYIVDTKTYIDNKFAELQQSLANTNAQLLGGN